MKVKYQDEKQYQKLIRDSIPEIMDAKGLGYEIRVLQNEEYLVSLYEKLHEELKEIKEATDRKAWIEEMADLKETMLALLAANDVSLSELETVRKEKKKSRGGFEKRLFLVKTFKKEEGYN